MLTPEQIQKNWNTYMNTRATPEQIAHTEACRAKRRLILEEFNELNAMRKEADKIHVEIDTEYASPEEINKWLDE